MGSIALRDLKFSKDLEGGLLKDQELENSPDRPFRIEDGEVVK